VADSLNRPDPAPWNDVDQAFFEAAPPDIPEPAPEPMRFDDLEPIAPLPPPDRSDRREIPTAFTRARAAASNASAAVRRLSAAAGRHAGPALASARRRTGEFTAAAWRRTSGAFRTVGDSGGHTTRSVLDRLTTRLSAQLLTWRGRAIVGVTIVVAIALPSLFVASRPAAHASAPIVLPAPAPTIGGGDTIVAHEAPATPEASLPLPFQDPVQDPEPTVHASGASRPHHAVTKRPSRKHKKPSLAAARPTFAR